MKTQNGFTLLENEKEFKQWLDKQHPTRKINKLQGLRPKVSTVDEWLSGDTREDVIGALEQGGSKLDDYLIISRYLLFLIDIVAKLLCFAVEYRLFSLSLIYLSMIQE